MWSTASATSRARVRVLDAQAGSRPSCVAGEEPVEEECPHAADVQEAGRARCHANADTHGLPIVERCRSRLVSDIHGNDRALAAVVEELERLGVERAVCLGDAVQGGDEPRQVLDRLAELGWPVVLGNADDFLLEVQADSPEPITDAQLEKRAWSARAARRRPPRADPVLSAHDRARLAARVPRLAALVRRRAAPRDRGRRRLARRRLRRPRGRPHASTVDARHRRRAVREPGRRELRSVAEFAVLTDRSVEFLRCAY